LNTKDKILIVNPHQFGHTTGYYYYCQYLQSEYEITYICFDEGLKKLLIRGIRVIYLPPKHNKIIRLLSFISHSIKESYKCKYDIIYIYSFYFSFVISLLSRKSKKILDVRTGSISKNPIKRYIFNIIIKFNTIFFRKVIVLSNDLISLLKLKWSKCHLLPLGSQKYFCGAHSFEEINLLYVGALNTRNISQTVEGFHMFLQKNNLKTKISYRIVGFGNIIEEKSLIKSIEKFGLKDYITFEGRKNYEELPYYFEECNIGISWIPITPTFNFQPATKTFEYLMSGLFCIATATKANKDIINSINGLLIKDTPSDFVNALEEVIKNKDLLSSTQIRMTIEEYSWQNLVINNLIPFLKGL
jgi:glycosyltransferase involved in cell wall biosynthesis